MDTTAASKRKRSDEPDVDEEGGDDSVIGLDVGGQLFYTHKSTLTAGSSYFAARFGGSFSAGSSYVDERGRKVYFIDGNGELFVHVLDYLRRGIASWPDQADDPKFYKRLVAEAEYFGVEAMLEELSGALVSISPNESGKGVLFWLGRKRGTALYQNPFVTKEVEVEAAPNDYGNETKQKNADFFGYRPPCHNGLRNLSFTLHCSLEDGSSRTLRFANVIIRPSHYSLRYGQCYGMSDWNFEASEDGDNWVILHKARKERHLLRPSSEELHEIAAADDDDFVSIVEDRYRQTWEVDSPLFYKYFRFASVCRDELRSMYGEATAGETLGEDGKILFSRCLHGVGFELFGDVKCAK